MFSASYGQLFAARALVGLGEAGYGSVGAAMISSHFPARMRGSVLAGFFASASVGSVLGVMLGGIIAARWGWQAAFGVVGIPGLILALLYLKVRDYPTVALGAAGSTAGTTLSGTAKIIMRALFGSRTVLWVCLGAAAQLIVVSAVWSWLPSFLNRFHGIDPQQAGVKAALVVLCGAVGSVVWGALADRAGAKSRRAKLQVVAGLCVGTFAILTVAFGLPLAGVAVTNSAQFALIALGGLLMTCTVGPAAAVVMDVMHPGVRSTGAAVLSLFQNLFGLAAGPFVAGALSDALGLQTALALMPAFGLAAALLLTIAARSYESESRRIEAENGEVPPAAPLALDGKSPA
jgi:MFS family permease